MNRLVCFLLVLMTFVGCTKKELPQEVYIEILDDISEILFKENDLEPKTLEFSTNTKWHISKTIDAEWLSVTPENGLAGNHKLSISITDGLTTEERIAELSIIANNVKKTITIRQSSTNILQEIEIISPQLRVMPTGEVKLKAINKSNGKELENVLWNSENQDVISINSSGIATAIAVGTSIITASVEDIKASIEMEVTNVFMTDGLGKSYTMKDLSLLSTSGVTYENGVGTFTTKATISPGDTLKIDGTRSILFGDKIEIRIEGTLDFSSKERVQLSKVKDAENDGIIYMTGDVNGGGHISNIDINGVYFRCFGAEPVFFEDCSFTGIVHQTKAAINLGSNVLTTVKNCVFYNNSCSAIAGGANIDSPLLFENNELNLNSLSARNRPQINVTVGGDGDVIIRNNTIVGPYEITPNGGIAVQNLMGIGGTNKVLIEGNTIKGCRYGLNLNGVMDAVIKNNTFEDNKFDTSPETGGEGISIFGKTSKTKVILTGNVISGHYIGVVNYSSNPEDGAYLNLGNLTEGEDYNIGANIFKNNIFEDSPCDLYNNSSVTVYAQGNTWNVPIQDKENIEKVIFHKVDQDTLGEVLFLPAAQ